MDYLRLLLFLVLLTASQFNVVNTSKEDSSSSTGVQETSITREWFGLTRGLQFANVYGPQPAPEPSKRPAPEPFKGPAPEIKKCADFEEEIELALAECSLTSVSDNCRWDGFCRLIESDLRIEFHQDSKSCCCACQQVENCVGVHRYYIPGKCIFHCGGNPEPVTDWFAACWEKPTVVK
eukprot:g6463.t1